MKNPNGASTKNDRKNDLKIQAVIFDWAGTIVDYGSIAPITALGAVFEKYGLDLSVDQLRADMGLSKRDHIRAIIEQESVAEAWQRKFQQIPDEAILDNLYDEFVPMQLKFLQNHCTVIPGVLETIKWLRSQDIRLGASTGYTAEMMRILTKRAIDQGIELDAVVCSSDVPEGRPAPWMCFLNAQLLDVYPMDRFVKVGDTPLDILEGRNAGMWTIATMAGGNEIGLSQQQFEELGHSKRQLIYQQTAKRLKEFQPHYVIESVAELPTVIGEINQRMENGERP